MAAKKRMGVESSETRAQLIEAARQLAQEEGCSAVTAGRLAEKVGLTRHIVHYYFGTIEDLFIAVIRFDGEKIRERLSEALESAEPLRVIWELANNSMAIVLEFTAMAMRRKAVATEVKRYMLEFREMTAQALARHLKLRGIKSTIPPVVTTMLITSISQTLAIERALGISAGHAETQALIKEWLRAFVEQGELFTRASQHSRKTARRER